MYLVTYPSGRGENSIRHLTVSWPTSASCYKPETVEGIETHSAALYANLAGAREVNYIREHDGRIYAPVLIVPISGPSFNLFRPALRYIAGRTISQLMSDGDYDGLVVQAVKKYITQMNDQYADTQ